MADLEKFEETERKIAQAENELLEHGKFVSVDWDENDIYHLEEHEKGSDNMLTKLHIKRHVQNLESKATEKIHDHMVESSMI